MEAQDKHWRANVSFICEAQRQWVRSFFLSILSPATSFSVCQYNVHLCLLWRPFMRSQKEAFEESLVVVKKKWRWKSCTKCPTHIALNRHFLQEVYETQKFEISEVFKICLKKFRNTCRPNLHVFCVTLFTILLLTGLCSTHLPIYTSP